MLTKKAKVIPLPTEDKNPALYLFEYEWAEGLARETPQTVNSQPWNTPQHLYFTTDEKIKEGDWLYLVNENRVVKCGNESYNKPSVFNQLSFGNTLIKEAKKIVAATDNKLIQLVTKWTDVDKVSKEMYKPIAQIPQQFVEEYIKAGGIDNVLLEYETNYINWKHDDKIEALIDTLELKTDQNNCVIIHRDV